MSGTEDEVHAEAALALGSTDTSALEELGRRRSLPDLAFHRRHCEGIAALSHYVDELLLDPASADIDMDSLSEDLKPFARQLLRLGVFVNEGRDLAARLSSGDLSVMESESLSRNPLIPPLETIRENLARSLKLARNVAAGNFNVQVEGQTGYAKAFNEAIADLRARHMELERDAYTDALTGAGNRAAYERRTSELWQAGTQFSMAYVDIDDLKGCNDRFGHDEGDRYITQAFLYLSLYFSDGVYRIGGDEFIVLAPGVGEDDLAHSLERCRQALVKSSCQSGDAPVFSFSYGCSAANMEREDTLEQVALDADRKMYAYKLAHKDAPRTGGARAEEGVELFGVEDRIFEALCMASPGRYLFIHNIDANESHWSPNAVRDLGLPSEHLKDTDAVFRQIIHPDDLAHHMHDLREIMHATKYRRSIQYRVRDAQGRYVMCECKGFRLDGDGSRPALFVGVVVNHSLAETSDPISGLPNIRGLMDAVGDCRQSGCPTGFTVVHVEGVDGLNTRGGYAYGDRVLAEVGARLVAHSMERARVFRGRGVKFCLVAEGIEPAELDEVASSLRRSLCEPIELGAGRTFTPTVHVASMYCPVVTQQPYAVLRALDDRLAQVMDGQEGSPVCGAAAVPAGADERIDPLTGLSRGSDFLARCNEFRAASPYVPLVLIKVDVGALRMFNEWHGKAAGDALLAEVAGVLAQAEEGGRAVAGYWGQDDFTLLVPAGHAEPEALLGRLEDVVRQHDDALGFRPSLGVYPLDLGEEVGVEQYSRVAFANLCAKRSLKERVAYFSPLDYMKKEQRRQLLSKFRNALSSGEITFYIQPQCEIGSDRIVGGEALARWRKPDGTLIPPGDFVPVLEESGFIVMLDKAIWREVFRWLRARLDRGATVVPISINISRIDVVSFDVAAFLEMLSNKYDVPTNLVKLEITETAYSQEQQAVNALAERLDAMGFSIYMDDFGAGLSSLNTLKTLNVDVIKLDRSFLPTCAEEFDRSSRIVSSVIVMARSLGLPLIVEGVETAEQMNMVCSMGVRYVQGFFYWKPMPCSEFEDLLSKAGIVEPRGMMGLKV